jgi:hypothetical protein
VTDFIPIYAPPEHYRKMMAHLLSLMTETQTESPAETQAEPTVPAETEAESPTPKPQAAAPAHNARVWPVELWRCVWPLVLEDTRKLCVALAANPGQRVGMPELEEELGSYRAVQSALSSLTSQSKKCGATLWPFDIIKKDPETGRAAYVMNEAMANIVNELARDA